MKRLPRSPSRTTAGFAFSILNRAIKEGFADRAFGKAEMQEVLAFFDTPEPECVFCGSLEVARWDHLFPISRGGDTVLGNMVLACARCDDSKQHLDFEEWMLSDQRYSPNTRGVKNLDARIARINEYEKAYSYEPMQIERRLNATEFNTMNSLQTRMAQLKDELEELIQDHRERTGKS
ncbi:MAG: HNH endonuclease [Chloroflexi bacterium]|nr:MAG: HNH endonuclease [Chloroflexota bacterium]MBL1194971.1 HNH endonuclease [Chloroflexota bacterium]NOH12260.1 HNH endonuclease [Chloroflexota bacterium]